MRLIECYIAGFGTIREETVSFSPAFNGFCRENGAGKSTMAAFIKAMLYGLPSCRSNGRTFDDRQHYYPFGGGAFGGSLTLEYAGQTYCITRRFDEKSDTRDSLRVTREGILTDELGKCPGETIFHVKRESFERTAFFTADPGDPGADAGIAARLQSLVDNTLPQQDYGQACAALEEAARQLKSNRGQTGKIYQQQDTVRTLEQAMHERTQLEEILEGEYIRQAALEGQLAYDRQVLEKARASQLLLAQWRAYTHLQTNAEDKARTLAQLQEACGTPLPTQQMQQELAAAREQLNRCRTMVGYRVLPEEKTCQLAMLQRQYPRGIPDEKTLDKAEQLHTQLLTPAPTVKRHIFWPALGLLLALLMAFAGGVGLHWWLWPGVAALGAGVAVVAVCTVLLVREGKAYRWKVERIHAQREATRHTLDALLRSYGLSGYDPQLRVDGFCLHALIREQTNATQARLALEQEYQQTICQVQSVFARSGKTLSDQPEKDITEWLEKLAQLPMAQQEAVQTRQMSESYRRENGLTQPPSPQTVDIEALQRGMEHRRRQLAALQQQIQHNEYRLDDLSDCHLQLQEAREQAATLRRQHRLLLTARACLEKAEQTLKQRHIDPVRTRFDFYAGEVAQSLGGQLALDKDFHLYLHTQAAQHSQRHLSAGQRAVAALCLRLSLLDNLYPGEQPPLILDDPFAFLDGEHLQRVRELVRTLADHRQILYFTCHDSRKI